MKRVRFEGTDGQLLSGRLELPDGPIRACALFAHCFTCNKNVFAASRVSRALARRGIATLRFDFTGLGESEGEWSETNFSTNVSDLVAAASFLRSELEGPAILIGHSFGGAAVLAAAGAIEECKAVCTIGAPFDPAHVTHLFKEALDEIEESGGAEVDIGGRPFRLRRQFVEDVAGVRMSEHVGSLGRALLVMHAPRDQVVGIENAELIFRTAKHPKSFVSLDDADHLLSRQEDAEFVADVVAAWAERYVDGERDRALKDVHDGEHEHVVVEESGTGKFTNYVRFGEHVLLADEPISVGGNDRGANPYELLLGALGACTSMTLRMYADRKGWNIGPIKVTLEHDKRYVDDCEGCEDPKAKVDVIERRLEVGADVSEDVRKSLLRIADRCPVHKTIVGRPQIETSWAE